MNRMRELINNGGWWVLTLMVLAVAIIVLSWMFIPILILKVVITIIEVVWLILLYLLSGWDGSGFIQ